MAPGRVPFYLYFIHEDNWDPLYNKVEDSEFMTVIFYALETWIEEISYIFWLSMSKATAPQKNNYKLSFPKLRIKLGLTNDNYVVSWKLAFRLLPLLQ